VGALIPQQAANTSAFTRVCERALGRRTD